LYIPQHRARSLQSYKTHINKIAKMKIIKIQSDRLLALMLISSLAACGPSSQPISTDETGSAQSTESMASENGMADGNDGEKMPDRFANMFVSEVTDTFNPGLQIGAQFPVIRALYQGEEITTVDRFIHDRGAIFIAARSVDW
jgi:hypothetical protein